MHHDNSTNIQGLARGEVKTLRALFQAGLEGTVPPAWLLEASNAAPVARLQRLGLVSERKRLTLSGLAVAVSLPPPSVKRRRWPLAA